MLKPSIARNTRVPGHGRAASAAGAGVRPTPASTWPARWNGAGVCQPGFHARASATPGLIRSRPVKKDATSSAVWL